MNQIDDIYRDDLLEEAREPSYFGELTGADLIQEDFNASCGDQVKVMIKLDRSRKKIDDLRWSGHGCLISQVAMSRLAQMVIGKSLQSVSELTSDDLKTSLQLPNITPMRLKCLSLGLLALQSAIKKNQAIK